MKPKDFVDSKLKHWLKTEGKEWAQSIIVALLLTLVIRTFVVQAFKIPSGSMRPTLMEGDKLFVDKFSTRYNKFKRGDIVVFKFPFPEGINFGNERIRVTGGQITVNNQILENPPIYKKCYYYAIFHIFGDKDFIKRLVAFEGETVEIKDGKIYINGQPLTAPETFGKFYYYNHAPYGNPNEKVLVPKNSYFVLGDNSASSADSRFWGFVPKGNMIGRAVFRWWPPSKIGKLQ